MQFWTAVIILVIVILLIIVCLYWYPSAYDNIINTARYKYDEYFTDPQKLYERTIGYELDDNAKLALRKAHKKDEMYTLNEMNGRNSKIADAAENSFILANLYNYNVAPNVPAPNKQHAKHEAAYHFNHTVARIMNNPVAVINEAHQAPEFMLDRTEVFYNDNAPLVRPNIEQARAIVRDARRAITQPSYFAQRDVPNDPQNVHDSQVNADMRNMYAEIQRANAQLPTKSDDEIMAEISNVIRGAPPDKAQDAQLIFDKMREPNTISSLSLDGSDVTERQLLIDVYQRITAPENINNRDNLTASFINALADGMDKNNGGKHSVCTTGRCSRLLGALTLLDTNPTIAQPIKTKEILRNEIFAKAHNIIQNRLAKSPNEADLYNGKTEETQENAPILEAFNQSLKQEISDTIHNEYSHSDKKIIDDLVRDAQAGVGV